MSNDIFAGDNIAFIGTGNMAEAIIGGLIAQRIVRPHQIIGYDVSVERLDAMKQQYGIAVAPTIDDAIAAATICVLAVKPQVFPAVKLSASANQLIVSVMAGVTLDQLMAGTGSDSIARSMPNTPALVGEGMTVWCVSDAVTDGQKAQAQAIFGAMGQQVFVSDEKYIDMATAMNGSGPAYVFLMMEAMIDAGVQMGLARPIAEQLVKQTFKGSVAYAEQSEQSINTLRNAVTSPGGTTAAALYAMEKAGIRTAIADGVRAAHERSVELGS